MLDNNPQGLQTVPGNKFLTKREIQMLGGCYSIMQEQGRRPKPTSYSYSGAAPLLENFGLPAIKKRECLGKLGGRGSPSIDLAGADQ
jgi:hypothetical protein